MKLPAARQSIPESEWPKPGRRTRKRPRAVWTVEGYLVQVFDEDGGIVRLSVNRMQMSGRHWAERIPWDDLQAIKDVLGFSHRDAVEIYPARADIVNVANMRHLWVLPEKLPYGWRAE